MGPPKTAGKARLVKRYNGKMVIGMVKLVQFICLEVRNCLCRKSGLRKTFRNFFLVPICFVRPVLVT